MVRRLAITGCLAWFLVSMLAEAHTWSRRHGQIGWASWYGSYHHGRKTASGERFSMHALTAAHRSLPFETAVRVTNLDTGQQVKVRINDRGPFVDRQRRIIDLSRAAAERIGLRRRGIGHVRIDVLEMPAAEQSRPATLVTRATHIRPPHLAREERAVNMSQLALAERGSLSGGLTVMPASPLPGRACRAILGRWLPHRCPGSTAGWPRPNVWPATDPSAAIDPLEYCRAPP